GLSGGVNLSDAEVTSSASTEAKILGDATITVSGAVTVDAGLTTDGTASDVIRGASTPRAAHYQNFALANLSNFGVGAISLGATQSDAKVDGAVRAQLDGDILSSGSVSVTANGTNTAISETRFISAGLAGLSFTDTSSEVGSNADVEALVGGTASVA